MFYYSTLGGELHFATTENFNKAIQVLLQGGHIKAVDDGYQFVDEGGEPLTSVATAKEGDGSIYIPYACYANLDRILDELTLLASEYDIEGYSDDGYVYAFVSTHLGTLGVNCGEDIVNLLSGTLSPAEVALCGEWFDIEEWEAKFEAEYSETLDALLERSIAVLRQKIETQLLAA